MFESDFFFPPHDVTATELLRSERRENKDIYLYVYKQTAAKKIIIIKSSLNII